ncbi:hypothetical protein KIN20_018766 [Parelaphostrongylus tenuis]|uniref:Uncharacterized protein n=1 Tax=Parelaphostrongylus tenuis TaxID=148309 RepID=A0AAD5QRU2_PARTN|nr:hypothetical protein KIN20_018766 [Parelaphostrongylus tenuis]
MEQARFNKFEVELKKRSTRKTVFATTTATNLYISIFQRDHYTIYSLHTADSKHCFRMISLLISSTLIALTIATPPIVPFAATNNGCVDGVNNVVDMDNVGDASALFIRVKDVVARTYDTKGNPSCYEGRAAAQLPGIIKLLNGIQKFPTHHFKLKLTGKV